MRRLRRVERPEPGSTGLVAGIRALGIPAELWSTIRDYLGIGRSRRRVPVADREALKLFLATRASHVAQTSLYGYLRTRAGMRYPELFDDDGFVLSINIAKWQIWLACLSDLAVFAGGLMARDLPAELTGVGATVRGVSRRSWRRPASPRIPGRTSRTAPGRCWSASRRATGARSPTRPRPSSRVRRPWCAGRRSSTS